MNKKRLAGLAISSVFLVALTACGDPGNEVEGLQGSNSSAVSSDDPAGKVVVEQKETAKKQSSPATPGQKGADSSNPGSSPASVPAKKVLQDPKQAAAAEKKRLSAKEQKYVEAAEEADANDVADDEAPAIDPRAVAEGGEATCQRLEFLENADPASVPGVLASDELANAEAAIRLLCPDFASQWRRASAGFADGQFKVGKKQAPATVTRGAYVAKTPGEGCTWTVRDKDGEVVTSGGVGKKKDFKMTVGKSAKQVESAGCYAWLPNGDGGNGTSG